MKPRLSRKEKQLLIDAARCVLAGEWPLGDDDDPEVLERAADKLEAQLANT